MGLLEKCFEQLKAIAKDEGSNAALAVINAAELAVNATLEKHPKRGDSWEETFTPSSCFNLSGAKIRRVELLLDGMADGRLAHSEVADEMTEEGVDAIVYLAFGLWKIGRL